MQSDEKKPRPDVTSGFDLDPILEGLGSKGRYQMLQIILNTIGCFVYAVPVLDTVFTGYQPDYQCRRVDNVTQLEEYLPDDVANLTLRDVSYGRCSIDVTVNGSGQPSTTHSLPCVAGVNFSMPAHTSFVTEWSLVCDKAGLAQLTQTGMFGGQVVGCLVFSVLADRHGRKRVYTGCALCTTAILVLMALSPNYYFYLVCKIASGFVQVSIFHCSFTLFIELMPREWRVASGMMDTVMWATACVYMALLSFCLQGLSWPCLSLLLYCPFLYTLLLPWLLDESLRWLVATGNIAEAERILKKACRMNGKDFQEIRALLHQQIYTTTTNTTNTNNTNTTTTTSLHRLLDNNNSNDDKSPDTPLAEKETSAGVLKNVRLKNGTLRIERMVDNDDDDTCACGKKTAATDDDTCLLLAHFDGSEKTGIHPAATAAVEENSPIVPEAKYTILDVFRYRVVLVPLLVCTSVWMTAMLIYLLAMLGSSRLSGNRFLHFGLLNLQDILSSFLALCLARRFNRRPLVFTYGMLTTCCLFTSVALTTLGGQTGVPRTLATIAEYVGLFAQTGSLSIALVFLTEVIPTTLRAIGTGAAKIMVEMMNMVAPFLFYWAEATPWAPRVLLGCLCCVASVCIWLLPETKDRKLPDTIQEIQAWHQAQESCRLLKDTQRRSGYM